MGVDGATVRWSLALAVVLLIFSMVQTVMTDRAGTLVGSIVGSAVAYGVALPLIGWARAAT